MAHKNRIWIGIDVGGTFTKAVAIDVKIGTILSKSTIPTTHNAKKGVSEGILDTLSNILDEPEININDIELISHSTTQTINALLESDTSKVGIIAMGVTPERKDIIRRTNLLDTKINFGQDIKTCHIFVDTSHLISEEEVKNAIKKLQNEGAEVIVAAELFGIDDPSNELFVIKNTKKLNIPSTASHEISGIYGLEIRTLTAAVNASVLPKTFQVANYVEDAIRNAGVAAPLMIMKGDGGVTNMETFRTKPILTVLSGPAASVAGALLHQKVTNGIFVEVGGTSTNICIIKNGKPEIRYVIIKNHPTCIRSMDVRVLGVAGGSMVKLKDNKVWNVGPRSAHIAGLTYSCFADPEDLRTGQIIMVKPKPSDSDEYVAIKCQKGTYAVTNTCAANALGMIDKCDYAFANQESSKIAMEILGKSIGLTFFETAQSIIQTSSFDITKTINKIMKDFKLNSNTTKIIGGGGGASVLVPFVAKQLDIQYQIAEHAEVISSVGVASSMLQEEVEQTIIDPTPEQISMINKRTHLMMIDKGAVPESIIIDSRYISEKSLLRVTAVGNVELDSADTAKNVFTLDEVRNRASEIIQIPFDLTKLCFKSEHYIVFSGNVTKKYFFIKRSHNSVTILNRFGKMKMFLDNGKIFEGKKISILKELEEFLESRNSDVSPQVYLVTDFKLIDYSSLTASLHILNMIRHELDEDKRAAVIIKV